MAAIGRVLLMDKGAYSGSTIYNQLDWVRDNGAAWVCKVDGTVGIAPPTLPTTSNANWTLLAADGSVSGSVEWNAINNKPFDTLDTTDDFAVDGSKKLSIKRDTFGTMRIVSGGSTTDLEASGDSVFEIDAGSNVTITADDSSTPKKITINSSGGGGGSSTFAGLDDVSLSGSPTAGQIVQYTDVSGQIKLRNVAMPTGGHTMLPTPSGSVDESAIVGAVNTALVEGGTNDDVGSLNTIGTWSNTVSRDYMVQATAEHPIGTSGFGDWEDESTMDGWIAIADLYNISAKEYTIEPIYDPTSFSGVQPVFRGYKIEDNTTATIGGQTVNCGKICMLFANEIDSADTETARVGIRITISRTPISYITP